jgi:hypothetical protein
VKRGVRHGRPDDVAPGLSVVDAAPGGSSVAPGVSPAGAAAARRLSLDDLGPTLSMQEVARACGVSVRTWKRWRQDRQEPVTELEPRTRRPRYAKVDVERYLANPRKGTPWQRRLMGIAS